MHSAWQQCITAAEHECIVVLQVDPDVADKFRGRALPIQQVWAARPLAAQRVGALAEYCVVLLP